MDVGPDSGTWRKIKAVGELSANGTCDFCSAGNSTGYRLHVHSRRREQSLRGGLDSDFLTRPAPRGRDIHQEIAPNRRSAELEIHLSLKRNRLQKLVRQKDFLTAKLKQSSR